MGMGEGGSQAFIGAGSDRFRLPRAAILGKSAKAFLPRLFRFDSGSAHGWLPAELVILLPVTGTSAPAVEEDRDRAVGVFTFQRARHQTAQKGTFFGQQRFPARIMQVKGYGRHQFIDGAGMAGRAGRARSMSTGS